MFRERELSIAGLPVWACAPSQPASQVILFFHGLHSDSQTHRDDLRRLASWGYLALGIDGMGHGRRGFDIKSFLAHSQEGRQIRKLLLATMWEIPIMLDQLQLQGYQDFACCGISWGAYLAMGAVSLDPRFRCAVSLLGCPDWREGLGEENLDTQDPFNWSPHDQLERMLHCPWLWWNGELDPHVPTKRVRQILAQLRPENQVHYRELAGIGHFPPPDDWNRVWLSVQSFLAAHFPSGHVDR